MVVGVRVRASAPSNRGPTSDPGNPSSRRPSIRLSEAELGIGDEEPPHAIGAGEGFGEEGDGLLDPLVGLGTTEAEEARAGVAEAFAAEAGDAEFVVGPLEQV